METIFDGGEDGGGGGGGEGVEDDADDGVDTQIWKAKRHFKHYHMHTYCR